MPGTFLRVFKNGTMGALPNQQRKTDFENSHLEVRMFNVGDGEAMLLIFPDNRCWLVDGGSSKGKTQNKLLGERLAAYIMARNLVLEAVVPTHPHIDHVGAFEALLDAKPNLAPKLMLYRSEDDSWDVKGEYPVWLKGLQAELKKFKSQLGQVTLKDAHHKVTIGDDIEAHLFAGSGAGVYTSIFLQLRFRKARLLFTGDAYCPYEKDLLAEFGEEHFHADVLKVTHHGSSGGTATLVVDVAGPGVVIASDADDTGHILEADTLDRLGGRPGPRKIFETVLDGDIILRTDGKKYGSKGILYHVECESPGLFADDMKASILTPDEADDLRTSTLDPDCYGP